MPEPTERGRRYVAGLDGMRALAVLSVIAYHLGFSWAAGGMLGVGVFFTLSGYLISDLLLGHWKREGELGLRTFWIRRARRLLPALFLMLAVVSVLVAVLDPQWLEQLRRQVLSAALYFANWSTIAQHGSYFARFAPPLPLDHLWSLAIEEQFYLVWPLLLFLGIWVMRGRRRLALLTLCLTAGSATAMALLYHRGYDPTRAYEGTDSRAFGLLIGATLAILWPSQRGERAVRPGTRKLLDGAGVLGLVTILVLVWRTSPFSAFLYPYGFLLLSLATAAVVAAAVQTGTRLGRSLGVEPLRWIGVRSYGIYLWQWPIIVLIGGSSTSFDAGRAALEVAATFLAAALSWRLVEEPIRRGALVRLRRRWRAGSGSRRTRRRRAAVTGAAMASISLPALGLAGVLPAASQGLASASAGPLLKTVPHPLMVAERQPAGDPGTSLLHGLAAIDPANRARRTSCRSVVYIGDSTSEGEVSTNYIPNPRQRLTSQLGRVGVRTVHPEISGARSIVETFSGHPNGATVAQDYVSRGYRGCWILALGTNDVADVRVGGRPGFSGRIERMMSAIGRQRVLWVDTLTLLPSSSQYGEDGMQAWNRDLLAACARHPNMRVVDWAALARRKWFIPDGIHYYSPGYVARARLISRALAHAFPSHLPSSISCLVR